MITIAIDGASGVGKSTLSDALAARLGILHLDTGEMYRAVGLCVLENGIDPQDEQAVSAFVRGGACAVTVRYVDGKQHTLLQGRNVSPALHDEAIGLAASAVSRYAAVRAFLVERQQAIARDMPLVMDGRDIGTVVLPDAPLKFFLTAAPETRARRRCRQLHLNADSPEGQAVLSRLLARDRQDSERAQSPLRAAPDAVILSTDALSFKETLDEMLNHVRKIDPVAR